MESPPSSRRLTLYCEPAVTPTNDQGRREEETLTPTLGSCLERKAEFKTPSGITVPRLLTPVDVGADYAEKVG